MWKYAFKLGIASTLLLSVMAPAHAGITTNDIEMKFQQYNPQTNLSFVAQSMYEKARGLFHEGKFDEAQATLEPLLEKYPDYVPLHILISHVHLAKHETRQALQSFRTARLKAGNNSDYHFKALLGEAQVYLRHGQTRRAVNLLTAQNTYHFTKKQQEYLYYQLAQTYKFQKNWVKMYDSLHLAIRYGSNQTSAREQLGKHRQTLARAKYYYGIYEYDRGSFVTAVRALRDANTLVPANPDYLDAMENAHEALLQVIRRQWWPDLEWVKPRLRNISFYLNVGRYKQAYGLYLDLLKNEHVRMFIMNDLTFYLPVKVRKQFDEIERVLIEQDYKLPRHRDPFWNTDLKVQKQY